MSEPFEIQGPELDRGYRNLREGASRSEREIRDKLSRLWHNYKPYADADFRQGFARDPEARFWEMYLGCTLLEPAKTFCSEARGSRRADNPIFASWMASAASG